MTENPAPAHLLTLLALQNVAIYVEIVAAKKVEMSKNFIQWSLKIQAKVT